MSLATATPIETAAPIGTVSASAEPADFTAAFRRHAAGVAVITADAGEGPVGLTATSVASVSVDPPMLVFSASTRSSSTPTLIRAATVVVHLLAVDDLPLARLCATSGVDRFADRRLWSRLETGEPRFTQVRSWIRARVVERVSAGGSTVVVAEALETSRASGTDAVTDAAPLVYHDRTWHGLDESSTLRS